MMSPNEFLQKWRGVELKERSASQSHFNDLCRLLGIDDPVLADPKGEWFTFEKGASKTSGGEGWADVWRKGCFAWEYKGPRKNLDAAFSQLLQYRIALENPPLLIVSDMDRIIVHTNWTNTVEKKIEFTLDKLVDGEERDRLKRAFTDPDSFKPTKTRQALTEETAREFASLAQRLRDRGHDAGPRRLRPARHQENQPDLGSGRGNDDGHARQAFKSDFQTAIIIPSDRAGAHNRDRRAILMGARNHDLGIETGPGIRFVRSNHRHPAERFKCRGRWRLGRKVRGRLFPAFCDQQV